MPHNNRLHDEEQDIKSEGVIDSIEELKLDLPDEKLIDIARRHMATSKSLHDKMTRKQDANEEYWEGQQINHRQLHDFQAKVVDNRVFMSVETILPILSARPHQPIVLPSNDSLRASLSARKHEEALLYYHRRGHFPTKLKQMLRHWMLFYIGVLKVGYDKDTSMVTFNTVRPQKLVISKDGNNVFEFREDTLAELIRRYPDKEKVLKEKFGDDQLGSTIGYWEAWTNEFVFWYIDDIVLDKQKNPYWNWDKVDQNFLEKPQHPYKLFSVYNLGENVYDDANLIEQVRTLQDNVNKRKRQISDNADQTNGIWIASSEAIDEDGFGRFKGAPNEKVYLDNGDATQFKRETGKPLPEFVFNDMEHSIREIDNIMGTHGTTRGEREGRETAKGRLVLKESDRGRMEYIASILDIYVEDVYRYATQVMKKFFQKERKIKILGKAGAEVIKFSTKNINKGADIQVSQGSSLPEDKGSKREEAIQLSQAGLLEPRDLFLRLGWSEREAEAAAARLFLSRTNPGVLYQDAIAIIEADRGETNRVLAEAGVDIEKAAPGAPQTVVQPSTAQTTPTQ